MSAAIADRRPQWLRLLPQQVEVAQRRIRRFRETGWDINALWQLHQDAQRLRERAVECGQLEAAESLAALADVLAALLRQERLPDEDQGHDVQTLVDVLLEQLPLPAAVMEPVVARSNAAQGAAEVPPPHYWRRWGGDAPPPQAARPAPAPKPPPPSDDEVDPWGPQAQRFGGKARPAGAPPAVDEDRDPWGVEATRYQPKITPAHAAAPAPAPAAAVPAVAARPRLFVGKRVYHLSGNGALAVALGQRLELEGADLELVDSVEEFNELLLSLPPDAAIVDAEFSGQLEGIGDAARKARQFSSCALPLLALAKGEDIVLRLSARRAGVNSLLVDPAGVDAVVHELQHLLDPERDDPFRILIVEDDRSQALFAESVLRKAGMDTMVVVDPLAVIGEAKRFDPDLILMDLHMPQASGIELTALVREQEQHAHTPIVFLSGEVDADRQFDALEAGGDDFLAKPIRPRHLIAAVQSRVRRHRAISKRARYGSDPAGLSPREALNEQLDKALAMAHPEGGVLLMEIEGVAQMRERYGLTAVEPLLLQAGRLLHEAGEELPMARIGDGSFLLFDPRADEPTLEARAASLRNSLLQRPFDVQGRPLRLRASVGVCALRHAGGQREALINAVERVCREARTLERGVRRYEPPKPSEAARETQLLAQLREAAAQHSLELLYQPIVAVAGGEESQFQALLRLRDTQGRLHSAAEVIPIAERGDFIVDIDRWVLLQTLRLLRDRRGEGRALRLFVTQSPLTLADPQQIAWLKAELASHEVAGTSLVIELRLADVIVHATVVRQFCEAMVADGVQFCLSQFEPGTEADTLFEQLPLGYLKLGRRFTTGAGQQGVRDELKTVIERAHRRGLEVIGHGVEDAQVAATLWMSGIDYIQGNLVQQADRSLDFDFQQAVL
jgi:EAL domain-containing protein (putative c-di-GMP-specific phosphodiesterase class I)/DNA-binding response OmpR family regulator